MESTVYIQAQNNFPLADWGVYALLGFRERGSNIAFYENIEEVPLNRYSLVVGGIEHTTWWFEQMGINVPESMTMPTELLGYAGRSIDLMTLGEALAKTDYPYFVKPYSKLKEFVGGVITKESDKRWFNDGIPQDTTVLVSEVVDFVSEYRGYVINGQLVGIKHYLGDFCLFPDCNIVKQAIADYASQPAAYSIDFGVTSSGKTLLIECNDGWSLGCYGLEPKLYVRLITTRWRQILEQNPINTNTPR